MVQLLTAGGRGTEPGTVIPGELEVRTVLPDELQRVATSLNDEHYCNNAFGSISRPNSKETSHSPHRSRAHRRDRLPPFACDAKDRGHGRIEHPTIEVYLIEPIDCGLPHVLSLVGVTKQTWSTSPGASGESEETVSYYTSSLKKWIFLNPFRPPRRNL